jgi:outer membrane protein OmpA-like peptidoglycan-associated protein
VNARILRLEHQRATLAASDPDLAEAVRKQIIELSVKHRVLCDHTGLLVLETEQDYARFHIDRRALADVLTVGAEGIALEHRTGVALAHAAPAESARAPEDNLDGHGKETEGLALRPSLPEERTKKPATVDAPAPKAQANQRDQAEVDRSRTRSSEGLEEERSVERRPPERKATVRPAPAAPPPPSSTPAPVARPQVVGTDTDHDGIPDSQDRCPNEPETHNGYEDQDGCPDRGRVIVSEGRIVILDNVYFPSEQATIPAIAVPILDTVAATMVANPSIQRVEVEGHSDAREAARISAARADAVKRYLVSRGVPLVRLSTRGYGRTRATCSTNDDDCQAKNRRVGFLIVRRSAEPMTRPAVPAPPKQQEIDPYVGRLKDVMSLVKSKRAGEAYRTALAWHDGEPGDVLALVALGESFEALGKKREAARAYGSLIDLFPGRADLRRFAGERLERLGSAGLTLAIDTYRQARAQRADHPASHRLLAYALLRAGDVAQAFDVIVDGAARAYPSGRFLGVDRILREDAGLIGAVLIARAPNRRAEVTARLAGLAVQPSADRSVRFVLNWETDANDVDFHIYDARGGHAFYQAKQLESGGDLYADVTTGYGPECFTIPGKPTAYPYRLKAHYYSRGPMGYGMGKLEVIEHDGAGHLKFDERPFVIMTDHAFVDLGVIEGPLAKGQE